HHISACAGMWFTTASLAKRSLNHCWVSPESGDPVEPSARNLVRSPTSARSISALVQLAKKAAPAPKNVALVLATNRHNVDQSGFSFDPPGLPSKMQQVVPFSRPATWQFHMIQPVELYQW